MSAAPGVGRPAGPGHGATGAALAVSLGAHVVLLALLGLAIAPDPLPDQSPPSARLDLSAYPVARSTAPERAPEAVPAPGERGEGARIGARAIPRQRADPAPAPVTALGAVEAPGAAAVQPSSQPALLPATPATPEGMVARRPAAERPPALDPPAVSLASAGAVAPTAAPASVTGVRAGARPVAAAVLAPSSAGGAVLSASAATGVVRVALALPSAQGAQGAALAPASVGGAVLGASAVDPGAARAAAELPEQRVAADRPPSAPGQAVRPETAPAGEIAARPPPGGELAPDAPAGAELAPEAPALARRPSGDLAGRAAALSPPAERMRADLAWSGEDALADPVSLAAIQSFMRPGDLEAAEGSEIRDGIEALLAAVPCARLQTRFDPETGRLDLLGHVPEEGLRAPVLAALRQSVGSAIPVTDNLLILPRPQCGVLAGIAATGLAQSTEQAGNPRVVGADAHARVYRFSAGERLSFDLTGPDYPALIYVDYFDAEGMVLHLQPNEFLALEQVAPAEDMVIGEALGITVSPPFGQEILVAFAASAPLYEGLRPLSEPAAPYLDFLAGRVAAARAADPGFKGEWVYFFVATSPG